IPLPAVPKAKPGARRHHWRSTALLSLFTLLSAIAWSALGEPTGASGMSGTLFSAVAPLPILSGGILAMNNKEGESGWDYRKAAPVCYRTHPYAAVVRRWKGAGENRGQWEVQKIPLS